MDHAPRESHVRSLLKGLSWRVVATLTTVVITYQVTGEMELAFQVGSIEIVAKIFIYYLHERAWQLVPRGTIRRIYRRDHGS